MGAYEQKTFVRFVQTGMLTSGTDDHVHVVVVDTRQNHIDIAHYWILTGWEYTRYN